MKVRKGMRRMFKEFVDSTYPLLHVAEREADKVL